VCRAYPEEYTKLIKARDAAGILELLTDRAVEKKVVERVRLKAATFGQDITAPGAAASSTANGATWHHLATHVQGHTAKE
jgi:chorismate mutase